MRLEGARAGRCVPLRRNSAPRSSGQDVSKPALPIHHHFITASGVGREHRDGHRDHLKHQGHARASGSGGLSVVSCRTGQSGSASPGPTGTEAPGWRSASSLSASARGEDHPIGGGCPPAHGHRFWQFRSDTMLVSGSRCKGPSSLRQSTLPNGAASPRSRSPPAWCALPRHSKRRLQLGQGFSSSHARGRFRPRKKPMWR